MNHPRAIDAYIVEQWTEGRFNSKRTEAAYRATLNHHADDAKTRGHNTLRSTDREDVLNTVARWTNPTTKRTRRAHLVSYYDWAQRNGHRPDNPARLTRGPKRQPRKPVIVSPDEIQAIMRYARTQRGQNWWAIELLAGTGIRNAELRALQVRDLSRRGWLHIRPEVGKGNRERWIPTSEPIEAIRDDLKLHRDSSRQYILASRQTLEVGVPDPDMKENAWQPMSPQALMRLVDRTAGEQGADIGMRITPHTFRHHYGYAVAAKHGIWVAQAVLGHSDVGTTVEHYTGIAGETEIKAVRDGLNETLGWPAARQPTPSSEAPTGIEPVSSTAQRHQRAT